MAATPDDPVAGVGRSRDPESALSAAEAAHLAARDTAPLAVPPEDLAHRETVRLPRQRAADPAAPRRRRAPLALSAAVAAAWAAAVSYVPVAAALSLAQLAADGGSVSGAARLALAGWLLAHGVPLDTPAGPVGLAPLGLTAFAAWRLIRAGVHT
ncbi:MAG TPA: DUF6350 family protein, partial [Pilimelia sp.]|nr:DUF6350 family protein [Pilimelia sp.]